MNCLNYYDLKLGWTFYFEMLQKKKKKFDILFQLINIVILCIFNTTCIYIKFEFILTNKLGKYKLQERVEPKPPTTPRSDTILNY